MNHVVLLSGLGSSIPFFGSFFRRWAKTLEKRLAISPLTGTLVWELSSDGTGEKVALDRILDDHRRGILKKVILVGHSNGARDILFIAKVLYQLQIPVHYAACLDMTLGEFGAEAYGNIKFLDEFHARLEKVDFHPSFQKSAANYRYWEVGGSHVGMASSKTVQDRLVVKIKETLR